MTGVLLARIVPKRGAYAIAEAVARLYFKFSGSDKDELRVNMRVVLGDGATEEEIDEHVLKVFINFAKYLVDFFSFPKFTEEHIFDNIEIIGREYLDECLSEGRGVILTSVHLGNWELGGAIVGAMKYPISAIVLVHDNKRINDFFVKQRSINDMTSIPIGLQIKECFKALKRNEALAIVGDKNYTSNGIYVDFFGKKALMPKGPAVIALRTSAPIIFTAVTREKGDKFRLSFEKPIKYKSTGDHEKDEKALMGEYLRIFEKYICKYPDQWYAFQPIWNQEQITQ